MKAIFSRVFLLLHLWSPMLLLHYFKTRSLWILGIFLSLPSALFSKKRNCLAFWSQIIFKILLWCIKNRWPHEGGWGWASCPQLPLLLLPLTLRPIGVGEHRDGGSGMCWAREGALGLSSGLVALTFMWPPPPSCLLPQGGGRVSLLGPVWP